MAFINIIEPGEATGSLKKIYDDLEKKAWQTGPHPQNTEPESEIHRQTYGSVYNSDVWIPAICRDQREMMAVVVSANNGCEYCQLHHCEALNHYWKDQRKIEQLRSDYRQIDLNNTDFRLCELARKLTQNPDKIDENTDIDPLKKEGLTDRAVLDAVLVISYFNFVNRIVEGLGIETDEEEVKDYKY